MLKIIKKTNKCGVICETNNKVFKTITEAAKYAGCNDWTMSVKMTAKGQFVDSLGRVYKRLRPMESKNTYTTVSDRMVKVVKRKKKADKQQTFLSIDEALKTPKSAPLDNYKEKKVEPSKKVPDIVKEAIKEKIINLLKQHGIYEQFMELVQAIGYESIKG